MRVPTVVTLFHPSLKIDSILSTCPWSPRTRTCMKNSLKYKPCNTQEDTRTTVYSPQMQRRLSVKGGKRYLGGKKVLYRKENCIWRNPAHKGQGHRNLLGNQTQKSSQPCGCHNLWLKRLCASSPFPPPSPPALKFFISSRKQTPRVAAVPPGAVAARLRAHQCTSRKLYFSYSK